MYEKSNRKPANFLQLSPGILLIREPLPYMIDMVVGLFEESSHVVVIDSVVDDIALAPWFELGEPVRGAYLHRWALRPSVRDLELELIAEGVLPAIGARMVAIRRPL